MERTPSPDDRTQTLGLAAWLVATLAAAEIVLLWLAIAATAISYWRHSVAAALLLIPYLALGQLRGLVERPTGAAGPVASRSPRPSRPLSQAVAPPSR